jgi:hypothetical protein
MVMTVSGFFCVVHALEGRLRLKVPEIKGAAAKALELERHLQQLHGVECVSASPATGSVLILYNPGVSDQEEIFFFLMQSGYLPQPEGISGTPEAAATGERLVAALATTLLEAALRKLAFALI